MFERLFLHAYVCITSLVAGAQAIVSRLGAHAFGPLRDAASPGEGQGWEADSDLPTAWVCAPSAGEASLAELLLREAVPRLPRWRWVLLATSGSGLKACQQLRDRLRDAPVFVDRLPLDHPALVRPFLGKYPPKALVLCKALPRRPLLFQELNHRSIPVLWYHGIFTVRDARKLSWTPVPLRRILFRPITRGLLATEASALRVQRICPRPPHLSVLGDLRAQMALAGRQPNEAPPVGLEGRGVTKVIVAGSTHENEERTILAAYRRLREVLPEVVLILVPRNTSRADEVLEQVKRSGAKGSLRSSQGLLRRGDVLVVDTVGELKCLYSLADVAFVGGSLIPKGGHNLYEPCVFGKPVLFGPHVRNWDEVADQLVRAGAAFQINNEQELYDSLLRILTDSALRQKMGDAAQQVVRGQEDCLPGYVAAVVEMLATAESGVGVGAA